MSDRGTLTTVSASTRFTGLAVLPADVSGYLLLQQMFRPRVLAFSALVMAVALWGFAYKISLYAVHPTAVQRSSVAKLWLEPDASIVAAKKLQTQSHLLASPQALSSSVSWLPRLDHAVVGLLLEQTYGSLSPISSIRPRSPPQAEFQAA